MFVEEGDMLCRAGTAQELLGILRNTAVVDARSRVPVPRCKEKREDATHAEPDDPNSTGAIVSSGEPATGCLQVVEGSAPAGEGISQDRADAGAQLAEVVEVGRHRSERWRCDLRAAQRRISCRLTGPLGPLGGSASCPGAYLGRGEASPEAGLWALASARRPVQHGDVDAILTVSAVHGRTAQ